MRRRSRSGRASCVAERHRGELGVTRLAAVVLGLVMAACTSAPPTSAPASPVAFALHVQPTAVGPNVACAGIGTSALLRGDPSDPEVAWLAPIGGGVDRILTAWPSGFSARFAPGLQILDGSGRVVLADGDFVDGGCVTSEQRRLLLVPPYLSARLVCGPVAQLECGAGVTRAAMDSGWPQHTIDTFTWIAPNQYLITFDDGSRAAGTLQP